MIGRRVRPGLVAATLLLAAVACAAPPPQETVSQGWHEAPLPQPGARVLAMAALGDELLALGSVPGPAGRAPAAWTTADARSWRALPLAPVTGYGAQAELVLVGVDGRRVSAYGQAFGGAHSNPRPTTWTGTPDGLAEHEQPFTLFGGEDAIATEAEAATGGTFLLAGAWNGASGRYGAAVWTSPDGITWSRSADAPGLASAPGEQTFARGAAAAPSGLLVLGSTLRSDGVTAPLAWTPGRDGSWQRTVLAATGPAAATAAACDGAGCTVLGAGIGAGQQQLCWPLPGGAGSWTLPGGAGSWTLPGAGPAPSANGQPDTGVVGVAQAVLAGGRVYAVDDVGPQVHLTAADRDCTHADVLPLPAPSADAAVGTLAGHVVLATTQPDASRLWTR